MIKKMKVLMIAVFVMPIWGGNLFAQETNATPPKENVCEMCKGIMVISNNDSINTSIDNANVMVNENTIHCSSTKKKLTPEEEDKITIEIIYLLCIGFAVATLLGILLTLNS